MSDSIKSSKDFVLEQARLNIERVSQDKGYVAQAKQVNASLASICSMERNAVMYAALTRSLEKGTHLIDDVN